MFDKFGNFNSASEINELAVNMRAEGDTESIKTLAKENGLDLEIVEVFLTGAIDFICDELSVAIGKLDVEAKELDAKEIMEDWVEYIKGLCNTDLTIARAVRDSKKSLAGCIGQILAYSITNMFSIHKDITAAASKAGAKMPGNVKLGMPGNGTVKKIIVEYYRK